MNMLYTDSTFLEVFPQSFVCGEMNHPLQIVNNMAVAAAKQQAVLLYQQQAVTEAQQVLLTIQELAGVIQQEIADYSLQYQQALSQTVMREILQSMQ